MLCNPPHESRRKTIHSLLRNMLWNWSNCRALRAQLLWGIVCTCPLIRNKHATTLWERRLDEGSMLGQIQHVRLLWKMGGKSRSGLHRLSRVHREIYVVGIEGELSAFSSVPASFFALRKPDIPVILLYCQQARAASRLLT